MGDDLLDLPVLTPRRPLGGAGRRVRRGEGARALGQPAPGRARRRARVHRAPPARAATRGRHSWPGSTRSEQGAGLRAAPRRAHRAARRPRGRQGVGALQARRRALDRSSARPPVSAFHPRPELPRRRPGRSGDRGTREGGAARPGRARTAARARQPVSREGPGRAARSRSTRRCCSVRASTGSSMPTSCSASASTIGAADSSIARSRRSTTCCKLDPDNEAALVNLEKLQEDQHQWQEAYDARKRLAQIAGPPDQPKSQSILAFLENELGLQALARIAYDEAARRFEAAIDLDASSRAGLRAPGRRAPAAGRPAGAVSTWERALDVSPRSRLSGARSPGARRTRARTRPRASPNSAARSSPRRRASGARAPRSPGTSRRRAGPARRFELLLEALEHNPHALAIHQAIWNTLSVLDLPKALVARLHRTHAAVGLLPRPARVHALPLPQHRAALAVPALPRVEHLRRGTDHAGPRRAEAEIPAGTTTRRLCRATAARGPDRRHRHRQVVLPGAIRGARRADHRRRRAGPPGRRAGHVRLRGRRGPVRRSGRRRRRRPEPRGAGRASCSPTPRRAGRSRPSFIRPSTRRSSAGSTAWPGPGAARWPSPTFPLLYETGREGDFDVVVVAACLRDEQIRRLIRRDGAG